ncbi:MAG: GspE/PulE family protein, partial [Nannocystaceae bacterium]
MATAVPPPIPGSQKSAAASPARPDGRRIGEILIEQGAIGPDALSEALQMQHLEDERVGEALVRLNHCTDWDVCQGLARQFAMNCREKFDVKSVDDELIEQLPIQFAEGNSVLPWAFDEDEGVLSVFAADPLKLLDIDDLSQVYDADLSVTLMPRSVVHELINKVYAKRTKDVDLERKEEEFGEEDEDILHASAEDAPIIRFVNSLIFNASKEKASDIHIEPGDKQIVVRNRVDGVLHEVKSAPKAHLASIIARVKIMAGLNIAEKRLPQDGRIRRKIAGKEVDMRVATVPTAHGER